MNPGGKQGCCCLLGRYGRFDQDDDVTRSKIPRKTHTEKRPHLVGLCWKKGREHDLNAGVLVNLKPQKWHVCILANIWVGGPGRRKRLYSQKHTHPSAYLGQPQGASKKGIPGGERRWAGFGACYTLNDG